MTSRLIIGSSPSVISAPPCHQHVYLSGAVLVFVPRTRCRRCQQERRP